MQEVNVDHWMKSEAHDIEVSLQFFLQAPYTHQFLLVFQILSKFSLPGFHLHLRITLSKLQKKNT